MTRGSMRALASVLLVTACAAPAPPVVAPGGASPRGVNRPPAAPRWALPTCPLRYEIRTYDTLRMEGGDADGVELSTFLDVRATPRDSFLELVTTLTTHPSLGKRKYRSFTLPITDYAPVHLRTDGRAWVERDGPTMVWGRLGNQGGIARLFPSLPDSDAEGVWTSWQLDYPSAYDTCAVEVVRGKHAGLTKSACAVPAGASSTPPPPLTGQVKLERWIEVGGLRAAVLAMTGTQIIDPPNVVQLPGGTTAVAMGGRIDLRGEYVVLSSGRLLRATVLKDMHVVSDWTTDGTTDRQVHDQHGKMEAHLVEACDGPTERTLAIPLSREERAIAALGEATMALANGDRDKALRGFDPELRRRHGDDQLWSALSTYMTERGPRALPFPVFVQDEQVRAEGALVHVAANATTPHLLQANLSTSLACDAALRESDGVFRVVRLRCDLELEKENLLDISPSRLDVVKGWPVQKVP